MVGPLLTSLPKVESSGGDDGPTTAAGTNLGVNVDHLPVLAVAPDGTQHIIQVKLTPVHIVVDNRHLLIGTNFVNAGLAAGHRLVVAANERRRRRLFNSDVGHSANGL